MAVQLAFDLPVRTALGRADYFVSASNADAVAQIDGWADWPQGKFLLIGGPGAGKTHLAHVWAEAAGARYLPAADLAAADPTRLAGARVVIDDADRAAPEALFHTHNAVLSSGGALLMTAGAAPRDWGLALPDLLSRMQATASALLPPPDDALLQAVLLKLLADRQIDVSPTLIPYLAARMDRSLGAAQALVARLDAAALARGAPVSRALAAQVLDNPGATSE